MSFEIELEEDVITKEEVKTEAKDKTDDGKILVLHNDDENTFDHVEECLIKICKHTPQRAKESAVIVHTRGKCDIYKGNKNKLTKMMWALQIKGLLVTIEDE
jgi:ATP-dependent Clp protease adaptor protein ClpS